MTRARLPLTKTGIAEARGRVGWSAFTEPHGLLFRTTPAGQGAFYLRLRVKGRTVIKRLASPDAPPDALRAAVAEKQGEAARGIDPWAEESDPTLADLVDTYEKLQIQHGRKNPGRTRQDLERGCRPLLKLRPHELTRQRLQQWFASETAARGRTSANRGRTMLLAMLRATGARYDEHAFRAVKLHPEEPRSRVLDDEEARRLLAALPDQPLRLRAYLTVLLRTGLRKTELAALRRSELDLQNGVVRLPGTRRKNGKPLEVRLDPVGLGLLKELRRERPFGEYVFPSRRRGKYHRFDAEWVRLRKSLGLDDVRLHDLRRSFGHRAALAGLTELEISAALGNSSLVSARHYTALAGKSAVMDKVRTAVTDALDKVAK